jgi:hypothetical protein
MKTAKSLHERGWHFLQFFEPQVLSADVLLGYDRREAAGIARRSYRRSPAMKARQLPIYDLEQEIVRSLRAQPRLVLQAPTGSGKSTQVPQILLDHGLLGADEVVILQPRRIAARLLANRVAFERGGRLGAELVIRFASKKWCRRKPGFGLSPREFFSARCCRIRNCAA